MMRVWLAVGLLWALACGGEEAAPFKPPKKMIDTIPMKDAAPDEEIVDASTSDSGMVVATSGPLLEIITPKSAQSATDDTLITTRDVTVRCRVKKRPEGADVNRSSIKITLDKNDDGTSRIAAAVDALAEDEYEAKFDVSTQPNGALRFRCEAADLAPKPASSSILLETLLDLGPTIELFAPKDKGIYALKNPVVIQFQVDPAPVVDGDSEAEVKAVRVQVSGVDIPVTESAGKPGLYQTSVDFSSKTLFKVPPTASEVLITVSNGRTPNAATRTLKADIAIDSEGPAIRVESPANTTIVHGEVTLTVNVTDAAGVAPRSLKADINSGTLIISDWDVMGSVYRQVFDTRKFGMQTTQLTINITATDTVGNQATIPHLLRLDNVPPVLALDPPWIREWRKSGENYYCSTAFDPVGPDATNDGARITMSSLYRVLVEDQTNYSPGSNARYYAGLLPSSVVLYVQKQPSIPLLIDTDNDQTCDEINFFDLPEGERPTKLGLRELAPRGSAWYAKPVDFDASNPKFDISGGAFVYDELGQVKPVVADPLGSSTPPQRLCPGTSMLRVVAGRGQESPPAVYALNPTNNQFDPCEGETWELGENILKQEGWACIAARAEDRIGNAGISEAIRVCYDRNDGGGDPCADPAPNCNKNCTISVAQQYAEKVFWLTR